MVYCINATFELTVIYTTYVELFTGIKISQLHHILHKLELNLLIFGTTLDSTKLYLRVLNIHQDI